MSRNDIPPLYDELIQAYLENEATPTEEEQFRLLLGEESFGRRVAEYAIDFGHLGECTRQGMLERALAPRQSKLKRKAIYGALAIAASILAVAGISFFHTDELPRDQAQQEPVVPSGIQPEAPLFVAQIAEAVGKVVVADNADFEGSRVVGEDTRLRPGEFLKTVGARSFALLKFADESVLAVAGETRLACSITDSQKRVVILGGDVLAQVASQPEGKPMLIETPKAHAEVVGTKLSLFANLVVTKLTVLEGLVRLKRISDGSIVEVPGGHAAIASDASSFAVKPLGSADGLWEEDFEAELPANWEAGVWVQSDLPPGSKGAVRAAIFEDDKTNTNGQFRVASPQEWWQGLFQIDEDTHINFTYKVERLGWFNVMLETRSKGGTPTYSGVYLFKSPEMWKTGINEWRTVSLPLREFAAPPKAPIQRPAPEIGHLVHRFYFSTQETDPGLVIDRIWITRGPATSAEVLASSK